MTDKMQSKVLEHLLDSYEKSKTFQGENLVNQNFSVNIGKLFPDIRTMRSMIISARSISPWRNLGACRW